MANIGLRNFITTDQANCWYSLQNICTETVWSSWTLSISCKTRLQKAKTLKIRDEIKLFIIIKKWKSYQSLLGLRIIASPVQICVLIISVINLLRNWLESLVMTDSSLMMRYRMRIYWEMYEKRETRRSQQKLRHFLFLSAFFKKNYWRRTFVVQARHVFPN